MRTLLGTSRSVVNTIGVVLITGLMLSSTLGGVPHLINFQGRVTVGGVAFTGTGFFKFALVSADGTATYWSNDDTSQNGSAPAGAVSLNVNRGLYTVLLGDTSLGNMTAVPPTVFQNPDVRLRVWFNDGTKGWQQLGPDQRVAAVAYALVADNVTDGAISAAKLAPGAAAANLGGSGQSAVGSGGVIMSRQVNNQALLDLGYVQFGKVETQDSWVQGAVSPFVLEGAATVWTGKEMICWGGTRWDWDASGAAWVERGPTSAGLRYNPATDIWTQLSTVGAPTARTGHTAVFRAPSGDFPGYLIVWGGTDAGGACNTGGLYDVSSDVWYPMSTLGAPLPMSGHLAIWTGDSMIVWGKSGGRYTFRVDAGSPGSEQWLPITTAGAPSGSFPWLSRLSSAHGHDTGVWTGTELIVFAGSTFDNGFFQHQFFAGCYSPLADIWRGVSADPTSYPQYILERRPGTSVWTGEEMIVYGGDGYSADAIWDSDGWQALAYGARYRPSSDTWVATAGGTPRQNHFAIWTGTEMIIWGGHLEAVSRTLFPDFAATYCYRYAEGGARYDPAFDRWQLIGGTASPAVTSGQQCAWTGTSLVVWGGARRWPWMYGDCWSEHRFNDESTTTEPPAQPSAVETGRPFLYSPSRTLFLYLKP